METASLPGYIIHNATMGDRPIPHRDILLRERPALRRCQAVTHAFGLALDQAAIDAALQA
jgi:hypothetical protein